MAISGNDNQQMHEAELDESAVSELCELARPHLAKCKSKQDVAKCIDECAQRDGGRNHLRVYPQAERRAAFESICSSLKESRLQRRKIIAEGSEVESAQVVLAAQDMVQSIQDMIEDVSEMQYKELPALVQAIKYDLDSSKADSFQQAVQGSLSALLDALQQQKVTMDGALGSITGEDAGAGLPGGDMGGDDLGMGGDDLGMGGDELPPLGGEEDPLADPLAGDDLGGEPTDELPEPEPVGTKSALGRGRR